MKGYATPEMTRQYALSHSELQYNQIGSTNLMVSQAGFGTYRVDVSIDAHHLALTEALLNGINLIDTSTNYADGGSEKLVGAVLQNLTTDGRIDRESVIVVSKVGYLQGQNYHISQQLKTQNKPIRELVEYGEGIEHCIHPDFIREQLTKSLDRLQLETVDIYLLHNPEYYLGWAVRSGISMAKAREEYDRRIKNAFMYLEKEVEYGRIQYYGISSNTFPLYSDDPQFTSLERVWEIAESISFDHHFRVIQLPLNLFENTAVTLANQSDNKSVLQFAADKDLAVLVNRPLNAFITNKLFRLVELYHVEKPSMKVTEGLLKRIVDEENNFMKEILPKLDMEKTTRKKLTGLLSTGPYLALNWQKLGPYFQWMESQLRFIVEQINQAMQLLTTIDPMTDEIKHWIENYIANFNKALEGLTIKYRSDMAEMNNILKTRIKDIDADWQTENDDSLTHTAIHALRSTEGITSTLVGMRREVYVHDILNELHTPVSIKNRTQSWNTAAHRLQDIHL
ncbi:MAG: aldo/keto reductase [Calditrichaceae bacterium]